MLRSSGMRYLIVGLLALFMFIPLFFVSAVIEDRAFYARETIKEVGEEWGGIQRLTGPQLVLPVTATVTRQERQESVDPRTGAVRFDLVEITEDETRAALRVFPQTFDADVTTATQERRRGIFVVPVYEARAQLDFAFDLATLEDQLATGERIDWAAAEIQFGISDNRALRGTARLTSGTDELRLEPLTGGGFVARTGDPRELGDMALELGFNGAQALYVAPVGRTTRVTIQGDWPHPSFDGGFLPDGSEVTDAGFAADWTVPHLARALPQVAREDQLGAASHIAFGLRYFQPNDFYQKAFRAARYGILYIALTFLTVLLIEDRTRKPAHPVQYLMIGLAQSVFVLMMAAYAEQIGFAAAYMLSAAATIALITAYGVTALKLGRRAWALGGILIALYAVLFLILRSADYALLAGATLAFAAVAAAMLLTRNEDWYGTPGTGRGWRRKPKGPEPDPAATP